MARPRLDDPTVPIAFRMKGSAWDSWQAEAGRQGMKPQELLRNFGEQLAKAFDARADFEKTAAQVNDVLAAGPELIEKLKEFASTSPSSAHTSDGSPESAAGGGDKS